MRLAPQDRDEVLQKLLGVLLPHTRKLGMPTSEACLEHRGADAARRVAFRVPP